MSNTMNNKCASLTIEYDSDGQLAERTTTEVSETFYWDNLALIKRDNIDYTIEPHVNGGSPIIASTQSRNDAKILFNDILGSSLGSFDVESSKFDVQDRSAFGESFVPLAASREDFFTGKPNVEGLGYAFLFRNYRSDLGKWATSDPLGYPDGWNNLAYVNNQVTIYIDWLGASGTLVIHASSTGDAGSLNTSGHAWISYTDDSTEATTSYGTWGCDPYGLGAPDGLYENREAGRTGDATRTTHLTDDQEQSLMDRIEEYRDMGEDAWEYTETCADFASKAWESATGEDVNSWWWTTPSELEEEIIERNGGNNHGYAE